MAPPFSSTIEIEGVVLPYLVEVAPYIDAHDVRFVVRADPPDERRLRTAVQEITGLIVAASAPPVSEDVTPLREEPAEYIVKIMVPMRMATCEYASRLRSYLSERLTMPSR